MSKLVVFILLLLMSACAELPEKSIELATNQHYAVVLSGEDDSFATLANRYLGDQTLDWLVADYNQLSEYQAGKYLQIPLSVPRNYGFYDGYEQLTPIITYHNFGQRKSATTITPSDFKRQLSYLVEHHYRVISLKQYHAFLKSGTAIPKRAVIITIDDGYRSVFSLAFPILKQFNMPATVFVYSDFISNGGLTKQQLKILDDSDLIDIQPHSKTHRNFNRLQETENKSSYQKNMKNMKNEVFTPAEIIEQLLRKKLTPRFFAFPYGEVNPLVLKQLQRAHYDLAFTMVGRSNNSYGSPLLLNRYHIFGNRDFDSFKQLIENTTQAY